LITATAGGGHFDLMRCRAWIRITALSEAELPARVGATGPDTVGQHLFNQLAWPVLVGALTELRSFGGTDAAPTSVTSKSGYLGSASAGVALGEHK
jgi:hypothetical protein